MDADIRKQSRRFYRVAGGVLLVYALISWRGHLEARAMIIAGIASALFSLEGLFPVFAALVFQGYLRFAVKIWSFLAKLFLVFFFYVIFTPYGLLIRWFIRDYLERKLEKKKRSYWIERPPSTSRDKACENPF